MRLNFLRQLTVVRPHSVFHESGRKIRNCLGPRFVGLLAMAQSVWRLRQWERAQNIQIAIPDECRVIVIFCIWRRIERLPQILKRLAAQNVSVQALIWDNSNKPDLVQEIIRNAPIPVVVHHSRRNIGGFGRFYLARAAAEAGHKVVIFIDDDLEFEPDSMNRLLDAHHPRSANGWWAFQFTGKHYESRFRCSPGEEAHYLGTGGMAIDTEVFFDRRLFACPRRFWFVEDLWLCYVAKSNYGYALISNLASIKEIRDGRNQSHSLMWVKSRLKRYMEKRGWRNESIE